MDDIYEIIDKRFLQSNTTSDKDYEELIDLIDHLEEVQEEMKRKDFASYIRLEWGNCQNLRNHIRQEGSKKCLYDRRQGKFYVGDNTMYFNFCRDINDCYCGQNCYDKK